MIPRLRRTIRQIARIPRGVVLLYHRVADLDSDPQLLAVSPGNFREHLQLLTGSYAPVSLGEVARRPASGRADLRRVAVTFDDGYADNAQHALPALQDAGVPATVFVVAGQVGRDEEFWWDDLERILLTTSSLPDMLELTVGTEQMRWSTAPDAGDAQHQWNVLSDAPASPRQAAYRDLCELLRHRPSEMRADAIASLRSWAGVGSAARPGYRTLASDELATLASEQLVSIGAHSMTHPVLSLLSEPEQRYEIQTSKSRLEELLTRPVDSFSYPFGGRGDYSRATVRLVADAGFALACANIAATVHWGTPRLEIPRFVVRDWTGAELARRLDAFLAS